MELFDQIISFLQTDKAPVVLFITMIGCGMGMPLNADIIMLFIGTMAGLGNFNPLYMVPICVIGLGLGDSIMHMIGKKFGMKVLRLWPFNHLVKSKKIYKALHFSKIHGAKVVFFVRFIPGTRSITVLSSGIFKVPFVKFFVMNLAGLSILCPTLIGFGYFFIASLQEAKEKAIPLLLSMMVIVILGFLIGRKIMKLKDGKLNVR